MTRLVRDLSWSTVAPGGADMLDTELAQHQRVELGDPVVLWWGAGAIWVGHVAEISTGTPGRTIRVGCEGWRARLQNTLVQELWVCRDLSRWSAPPQKWIVQAATGLMGQVGDLQPDPGGTGQAIRLQWQGAWDANYRPLVWMAFRVPDGCSSVSRVDFRRWWSATMSPAGPWRVQLRGYATDQDFLDEAEDNPGGWTVETWPASFGGVDPYPGWASVPGQGVRGLSVNMHFPSGAGGVDGAQYSVWWRVAVWGSRPVPVRGDTIDSRVLWPSDVARDVVARTGGLWWLPRTVSSPEIWDLVVDDPTPASELLDRLATLAGCTWCVLPAPGWDTRPLVVFQRWPRPGSPAMLIDAAQCDSVDVSVSAKELYDTAVVRWQEPDGWQRTTTVQITVPELAESPGRAVELQLGVSNADAAAAFGRVWLAANRAQRAVSGSLTVRDGFLRAGARLGRPWELRPGLDRLVVRHTDGRVIDGAVTAVRCRVDQEGRVETQVELGVGAQLVDTLVARISDATRVAG